MISHLLHALGGFVMLVISHTGYLGILLMMAIESACIPLPSEVIMPFSGALTVLAVASQYGRDPFSLLLVATIGALGCNLGSVVAYEIGAFGGRPLVERYGRYIMLNHRELDAADHFFQRWGSLTVFIGRLLPVVRTFIALPAGISRMNRVRFHVYTFLGSWPWCFVLAYAGRRLGENWDTLGVYFHRFDGIIGALLVLGVVWFVWTHLKGRLKAA
jgi:membrane protein DedA with SNARE-associated domain